ncbi:MAG TPA: FG-GAP-like repeat-containing protein [Bacteroidia bacterium]|jgi:hypothetical protein|nr:FG-GAP-like repeat-containing protein [Bacteroidia bacterium]
MKKFLLIILFACINQTYGQLCFSSATNYVVDSFPQSVVSVDLNNDGILDLATANYHNTKTVSTLLGNGNGAFSSLASFTGGTTPRSITATDINSDGKADVVVANNTNQGISVFYGNGTGGFSSHVNIPTGNSPTWVTNADFNKDGKQDLAVTNYYTNEFYILLGTGSGGFSGPVTYTSSAFPESIICIDFNSDSNLDLAVTNIGSSSISIFLGDGAGNFTYLNYFYTGGTMTYPYMAISADFNSDGKADLATANDFNNSFSNNMTVFLGNGNGTFGAATNYSADTGAVSLTSADFDLDGKLDIAVANMNSNNVSIFLGDGMGSFATPINFSVDKSPATVISADFNGDGKPDLATANLSSKNVSILLNCSVMGIANFNTEQKVSIYPNPTSDQFSIEANTTDKLTVNLYDINGRHVFNASVKDKQNINVTSLNEGVYTLTIKTADRVINKKVIILR